MWITNVYSADLTKMDRTTGSAVRVALPSGANGPYRILFDGRSIWTANQGTFNVSRITL